MPFVAASLAVALVAGWLGHAPPVAAHGKAVTIAVTSLVPDPDRPLIRLYRARVTFTSDGDPVDGATVVLSASRGDGEQAFPAAVLTELGRGEGLYAGEVEFVRFGSWTVHLSVTAAVGEGQGETTFSDDIRPETLSPAEQAAQKAEGERVARLQVLFRFNWWPDVVTIAVRILHTLAAIAYFSLVAVLFGLAWIGVPANRPGLLRRLGRGFLPAASAALGVLLLAGVYSAAFDAPVTWPGVFDVAKLRRIPYGDAYLALFLVKVAAIVVLGALTALIHRAVRPWAAAGSVPLDRPPVAPLRRLTLAVVAVGFVVAVDVAVLVYVHYISHVGAFLPPS